ncbi:hypothetical protein [Saccharothrix lopnurensis]|uniref:Tetratricopeptide repeat protein n=1 Tax=Saccharothrix lopnurensis TaxID=1670621 RepID=A0ABW1PD08_9PSEU
MEWSVEEGRVLVALGAPAEVLTSYRRALGLQQQLDDDVRQAAVLDATGEAYQVLDRHDDATGFHRRAAGAPAT